MQRLSHPSLPKAPVQAIDRIERSHPGAESQMELLCKACRLNRWGFVPMMGHTVESTDRCSNFSFHELLAPS